LEILFGIVCKQVNKEEKEKEKKEKILTFLPGSRRADGLLSCACPRGPSSVVAAQPASAAARLRVPAQQPSPAAAFPLFRSLTGGALMSVVF
jgi:hypothetical protein